MLSYLLGADMFVGLEPPFDLTEDWLDAEIVCVGVQVDKIVGRGAPEDFVEKLEELANAHHDDLEVDVIRAYFFGARFIVEMEVVMPEGMTVRESHDIALVLQHKLEAFDEVERAFVHGMLNTVMLLTAVFYHLHWDVQYSTQETWMPVEAFKTAYRDRWMPFIAIERAIDGCLLPCHPIHADLDWH